MNKLRSFAAVVAAALIGGIPGSAWSDETTSNQTAAPAEQTPAPATAVAPRWNAPRYPGGYAQTWQQPPHWGAPQPGYGQYPPQYPQGGQYPAYTAAPATTRENPLTAELKKTQEQLAAKSSELDDARGLLEQLRDQLKERLAAEARLADDIAYGTREQQALRVRVIELTKALKTSNVTLEQQHQLIDNHQARNQQLAAERDQLHSELDNRDEQLAALQSELQAATQALSQARSRAGTAAEALSAARAQLGMHRDALKKLEAELERLEARLQGDPQTPTE